MLISGALRKTKPRARDHPDSLVLDILHTPDSMGFGEMLLYLCCFLMFGPFIFILVGGLVMYRRSKLKTQLDAYVEYLASLPSKKAVKTATIQDFMEAALVDKWAGGDDESSDDDDDDE